MTHKGIIHMPAQPVDDIQLCTRCRCVLINVSLGKWPTGRPVVYERGSASVIWPNDDISQARECKARPAKNKEVA